MASPIVSPAPCAARRGITVIETLVAVAILAILAGISVPALSTSLQRSKINSTRAEMAAIGNAMRAYARDRGFDASDPERGRWPAEHPGSGSYPSVLGDELEVDPEGQGWNPALRRGWNGPYLIGEALTIEPADDGAETAVRSYQVDAWNRYYLYRNRDGSGGTVDSGDSLRVVEVRSGGPDRTLSTDDDLEMTVYQGPIH
jgi:type II secretory pathway pseudopilin PulG